MTDAQREALTALCERYKVPFNEGDYTPAFDLPDGWVDGWVGGVEHASRWVDPTTGQYEHKAGTIFVGCDPEGRISS